jgi:SMODS and SLOG-associating 2TM effector domain family 5
MQGRHPHLRPAHPSQTAPARGSVVGLPTRSPLHQKHIRDWRLVKRARFNAAERHQRQEKAATTAFSLAGIFGFVVPYFLSSLDNDIPAHFARVMEPVAVLSGALALVLGLIERGSNHLEKARRFHECGMDVNDLLRQIETHQFHHDEQLRSFQDAYHRILQKCEYNHLPVDRELALAEDNNTSESLLLIIPVTKLTKVRWQIWWQVHGAYWTVIGLPILVGLAIALA